MDGVKSEPDAESDVESASPQYEPQFVKVKEEHMADDNDNDELSDPPDEETAEAVMFPIVKTEYHADTVQKDAPDEEMFGAVRNESKVRFICHIHHPLFQHIS
jgi:hypothetical protein